ncbi:MAG: ethanolamine ammonia-lyase reactivating factor EutA [Thermodesulfobacteriota bacterium]
METPRPSDRPTSVEFPSSRIRYRMHEEYMEDGYAGLNEEDHPMWGTERIEFRSVGIDIGSSTSHLMFSRLVLRRLGTELSSRFVVVHREITWKSSILLTPYLSQYEIDVKGLSEFLDQSYRSAGVSPERIDTGAVIITGEASRKENAEAITALFAKQAGKFVCATAGPNLEAMMAAYGSGAVRRSIEKDRPETILSIDVGGGTSKIAVVRGGSVQETAATNVGGRLVATDDLHRIVRIEEAGAWVAKELGIDLRLGKYLSPQEKESLASRLADILFETIERKLLSPLAKRLMITPPLDYDGKIDSVMFSGGVGEYIYGFETEDYHDLGRLLGMKIAQRARGSGFGIPLAASEERIRATVIGASQYTVQVSGNTIFVSNEKLFPMKNLKVLFPRGGESAEGLTSQSIEAGIQKAFGRSDLAEGETSVALAFHWKMEPRYEWLRRFAEGIALGLCRTIRKRMPVVLVFDSDVGKIIGNLLYHELKIDTDVVSIDQVHLHEFDYIDIGEMLEKVEAVPIVVKSLVFGRQDEDSLKNRGLKNPLFH